MSQDQPAGTIVWKAISPEVENADVIRDFYAEVVGLEDIPRRDMGGYNDYNMMPPQSDDPVAGICHARGANANLPVQWLIARAVAGIYDRASTDIDSSIRRCIELGGSFGRRPP